MLQKTKQDEPYSRYSDCICLVWATLIKFCPHMPIFGCHSFCILVSHKGNKYCHQLSLFFHLTTSTLVVRAEQGQIFRHFVFRFQETFAVRKRMSSLCDTVQAQTPLHNSSVLLPFLFPLQNKVAHQLKSV